MLELAILGLLQEKASYGYELKKQLDRKLGHFWQVSMGSLYPALDRLAEQGAVEVLSDDDRASRRSKKVYRITSTGEELFEELIEDRASTQWEEEKVPLRLAFFHYVKPEIRIKLLERRKVYLQEKLDDLRASLREAADRADSYTLSLMRHGMETTAADIEWLEELIAAERNAAEEAGASAPAEASGDEEPPPFPTPALHASEQSPDRPERQTDRTTDPERAPVRSRH